MLVLRTNYGEYYKICFAKYGKQLEQPSRNYRKVNNNVKYSDVQSYATFSENVNIIVKKNTTNINCFREHAIPVYSFYRFSLRRAKWQWKKQAAFKTIMNTEPWQIVLNHVAQFWMRRTRKCIVQTTTFSYCYETTTKW